MSLITDDWDQSQALCEGRLFGWSSELTESCNRAEFSQREVCWESLLCILNDTPQESAQNELHTLYWTCCADLSIKKSLENASNGFKEFWYYSRHWVQNDESTDGEISLSFGRVKEHHHCGWNFENFAFCSSLTKQDKYYYPDNHRCSCSFDASCIWFLMGNQGKKP